MTGGLWLGRPKGSVLPCKSWMMQVTELWGIHIAGAALPCLSGGGNADSLILFKRKLRLRDWVWADVKIRLLDLGPWALSGPQMVMMPCINLVLLAGLGGSRL